MTETWAKGLAYRTLGRLSNVFDYARPLMTRLLGDRRGGDGYDKTGLVQGARSVVLEHFPKEICLVRYGSLAHTFWRAQELTLIYRHRHFLERPRGDFGCGDGSFGAALFPEMDYGIDNDPEALEACGRQKAYAQRILSSGSNVPLPSGSLGSVMANSVLEHTLQPEIWLMEIARLLRPGGVFMMTVPLMGFARHLARYFGWRQSRRVNQEYHHYNLVEMETWLAWLRACGFDPFLVTQYQSSSFTFWYRMLRFLGERGAGAFPSVQEWFWARARPRMLEMIRESVESNHDGANLFVVARRL